MVVKCSEVRYSFEQLEIILYKQAHRVKKFFPNKYGVDELVNEVWAKGSIQKLDNIKYVAARAYYDMIDYLKKVEGRQFMRKGVFCNRPKYVTNMHNIKRKFDIDAEHDFFDDVASEGRTDIDVLLDREEINDFLSSIPERRAEILRDYFLKEKSLEEVGKIHNIAGSTVCDYKQRALEEIRYNYLINEELEKIEDEQLEDVLPEYVADFKIGNEYATNEKFKWDMLDL